MKYFLSFLLALTFCVSANAQSGESFALTPAVTLLTGAATNSTAGTVKQLSQGENKVTIYLTASGVGATTNGSLVVKFSTASGSGAVTNNFTTASLSDVKLTMSSIGNTTNTISDWFELPGVKYIRVGQIENTFVGAVSNISIRVAYPNK